MNLHTIVKNGVLLILFLAVLYGVGLLYERSPSPIMAIDHGLSSVVLISAAEGHASGVIITEDGRVLTNRHVVEGLRGDLTIKTRDGREFGAEVLWTSTPEDDTALLQLVPKAVSVQFLGGYALPSTKEPVANLTVAPLRCEPVAPGTRVYAIGNPVDTPWTVTAGIVSAYRGRLVQIDALLLPGNSGGGLFTEDGYLIGLPNSIHLIPLGFSFLPAAAYAVSGPTICHLLGRRG